MISRGGWGGVVFRPIYRPMVVELPKRGIFRMLRAQHLLSPLVEWQLDVVLHPHIHHVTCR
jgi:hypothetical protein